VRPHFEIFHMLSPAFVTFLTLAVTAAGSLIPYDSRSTPPAGFVHKGAAPASQSLTLRVGLASADVAGLETKLQSISNPTSDEYAQWLTAGTP
jgi:tripeptidyl-peptidase I